MKIVSKSSFTLFELLIVILIISIIYGIFIQKLGSTKPVDRIGPGEFQELEKILQEQHFREEAKIVCVDKCKKCYIYVDGRPQGKIEGLFEEEPKVYDFDIHGILSEVKFVPIFDKEKNPKEVCFEYALYPNGSRSSYIMEYKDSFYVFDAYMRPVRKVASISEAQDLFDPSQWTPTGSDEYNF